MLIMLIKLNGHYYSNYASYLDKRRSLIGSTFTFGGNFVSRKSCLQHIVALSTIEVAYVALIGAIKEVLWLKGITNEFGLNGIIPIVLCESQSVIHLSRNNSFAL